MEIAGLVVAVLSLLVAVVAIGYAAKANKYAANANETAERAHTLQATIDERGREVCDVQWDGRYGSHNEEIMFRLTNVGLTPAHNVTLTLAHKANPPRNYELGDLGPGESGGVEETAALRDDAVALVISDVPYRVQWSSPLGTPGFYRYDGIQVY